jgi:hypothetical protein
MESYPDTAIAILGLWMILPIPLFCIVVALKKHKAPKLQGNEVSKQLNDENLPGVEKISPDPTLNNK